MSIPGPELGQRAWKGTLWRQWTEGDRLRRPRPPHRGPPDDPGPPCASARARQHRPRELVVPPGPYGGELTGVDQPRLTRGSSSPEVRQASVWPPLSRAGPGRPGRSHLGPGRCSSTAWCQSLHGRIRRPRHRYQGRRDQDQHAESCGKAVPGRARPHRRLCPRRGDCRAHPDNDDRRRVLGRSARREPAGCRHGDPRTASRAHGGQPGLGHRVRLFDRSLGWPSQPGGLRRVQGRTTRADAVRVRRCSVRTAYGSTRSAPEPSRRPSSPPCSKRPNRGSASSSARHSGAWRSPRTSPPSSASFFLTKRRM